MHNQTQTGNFSRKTGNFSWIIRKNHLKSFLKPVWPKQNSLSHLSQESFRKSFLHSHSFISTKSLKNDTTKCISEHCHNFWKISSFPGQKNENLVQIADNHHYHMHKHQHNDTKRQIDSLSVLYTFFLA